MTIHSLLKKMDQFEAEELMALKKFKNQGGKIAASFCRFFPASLLTGVGLRHIRILSGTTVQAESTGERLVRSDACSFCKSILGNFINQTAIHALIDLVIGVITCDQMRRTLERIQTDLQIPVFPVQYPATNSPEAEDYYVANVHRVIMDISEYLKTPLQIVAVRHEEQNRYEAADMLIQMIGDRRVTPIIIHRLSRLFFMIQPKDFIAFLNSITDAIPDFKPKAQVVVIGSVSTEGDDMIYNILSEREIGIIPLNCTGLNALESVVDIESVSDEHVIDTLSRNMFRSTPCIRCRPNTPVYERLAEVMEQTAASGIILKTLPFCDLWFTEKERLRRTFDIPILVLDSGYGKGIEDRIGSRIDAFLETLEC